MIGRVVIGWVDKMGMYAEVLQKVGIRAAFIKNQSNILVWGADDI